MIGLGDLNLDYRIDMDKGNDGYDELFKDNIAQWIKPSNPIDTNWSDRNRDDKDDYPKTILDFAFVANEAKNWGGSSKIIQRDGDFPDTNETSDHRPIQLELTIP